MSTPHGSLSDLPNLGPASQRMLAAAHIHTLDELRTLGAVQAYWQVRQAETQRSGRAVSLNLLWALEGALTGLHWQTVARVHRTSLLLALDTLEHAQGTS
jgi:DNA transformation protein